MFLNFHTLRYKNLLSSGNTFIELELDKHPTTLITARNGSGKSSAFDALVFALYGKPYRKITKPNLVNSINKKNLLVEIEFSVGSSKYMVRRGIKPNVFEIYQDGKMLESNAAMKDQQEYLEEQILKLNYKSFCQIVIQGSSNSVPFMQLTAQHRREIVEDLLDLQVFSLMNTLLKEKVSANKKEITETEHALELVEEKIKMQTQHSTELKDAVLEQISNIENEIESNKSSIETYTSQIDALNTEVVELNEKITDKGKIEKKKKQLETFKVEFNTKIQSITKDCNFFTKHDDCPTCRQKIDEEFKKTMVTQQSAQKDELLSSLEELNKKLSEIESRENEITVINRKITDLNLEIHQLQTTVSNLNKHITKLRNDIDSLNNKLETFKSSDSVKLLNKEKDAVNKKLEELLETKEIYTISLTLLKDSGIKSRILKQYIPVINKLINKYLSIMEFYVDFELDENFNENIRSRNREDFTYMNFSEGEKQRIDLSILFAWRAIARMKNSASTNLLVLDETMDSSLDTEGTEHLMRIISNLDESANIFVVSHKNDMIIDKFDHIIEFEKVGNFTRLK